MHAHYTKHNLPEPSVIAYTRAPGQTPCFWCWGTGVQTINEDRKESCDMCVGTGVRIGRV